MLSQKAWKIGRAFTKGQSSAPAQFAEVEREANGLSDALKLTADALHADGSILSKAEPETKVAVYAILESAGRTLEDLESFVEQYQVVKKRQTTGGFVVEKTWREAIIANWRTFKWTTEGGDITELRNMLQMHTNTINLTMQALQSHSLARLERTVIPMAQNIASIHERVNGDLGDKIDELHDLIMSIASSTPSLVARDRSLEDRTRAIRRTSSSTVSTLENVEVRPGASRLLEPPRRRSLSSGLPIQANPTARDSVLSSPNLALEPKQYEFHQSSVDWEFESGSPPRFRRSSGGALDDSPNIMGRSFLTTPSPGPSSRHSNVPRRESTTLPALFQAIGEEDAVPGSSDQVYTPERRRSREGADTLKRKDNSDARRHSNSPTILPPPAISNGGIPQQSPATPSSFFNHFDNYQGSSSNKIPSRPQTAKSVKKEASPSSMPSSLATFEKSLFRNAAILCDVRGKQVEFAKHLPDEPDERYNVEMVEAVSASRICVIRKRENKEHGGTRVVTSIWALSEDGDVRCQQRLSEYTETVPFSSYFQPEKVSLAEGEMALRLHGDRWGDMLKEEIKTNWINYIFESESDASAFQSAVFGRLLLGTYQTLKTTVIHDGLMGAFAFEEQFANIETLRLWEDDGIATEGAQGGVLALMHISSNFGSGWARWWMNSSKQPVRVKADSNKCARLKGLDITVVKPGTSASAAERLRRSSTTVDGLQRAATMDSMGARSPPKRLPVKTVKGVKIEFKEDGERDLFLETTKKIQERLHSLPDL